MKKLWTLLLVPLCTLVACTGDDLPGGKSRQGEDGLFHEMIQLGEKLDDPYTVENMRNAVAAVYPTRSGRVDISVTDYYVRFLPRTEAQLDSLLARGLDLTDHPVDYRILREGDYYHDPAVDEEEITWQYTVVGKDFDFPDGITYEILDECYLSENDPVTRAGSDIDWDAVEEASFRLTGNGDLYVPPTKAGSAVPQGRITIEDPDFSGGKPFGVAGVTVVCNSFVRFDRANTDRDGYYQMTRSFSSNPRYRLLFSNKAGFSIGMNLVIVPASVSTLGKGSPEGIDYHVSPESEGKLFRRCVANNAAYDYISRCTAADLDILPPPSDIRIWMFRGLSSSSCTMLHHGAFVDRDALKQYLGGYAGLLKTFLPDLTIGTQDRETYAGIYTAVVHELAHASHFAQVGKNYWTSYIDYIIKCYLLEKDAGYGSGNLSGSGYCELGEMWGYFMENSLYQDRYGGPMPEFGGSWWFRPEIFAYLYERGMTRSEIFRALQANVTSRDDLKDQLIALYPEREELIDQVFARYGK